MGSGVRQGLSQEVPHWGPGAPVGGLGDKSPEAGDISSKLYYNDIILDESKAVIVNLVL